MPRPELASARRPHAPAPDLHAAGPQPGRHSLVQSLDAQPQVATTGKRGSELTSHRPGSLAAKADYLVVMDGDDTVRARQLVSALAIESELQRFYQLQVWLGGDNRGLVAAYRAHTQRDLHADLGRAFTNEYRARYLQSVLAHGQPQLADRVRLALGLVTGTRADKKEIVQLFLGDADRKVEPAEKIAAFAECRGDLDSALGGDKVYDFIFQHVESLTAQTKLDQLTQLADYAASIGNDLAEDLYRARADGDREQYLHKRDREAAALVHTCKGTLCLDRKKLGALLPEWSRQLDDEARAFVVRDGSQLQRALREYVKSIPVVHTEVLFTQVDVEYALDIVRHGKVAPAFFRSQPTPQTPGGIEKREENRGKAGAIAGELAAYFDRKVAEGADKVWQWDSLKDRIVGLSDEQKDWFLRSHLTVADQLRWDDPALRHATRLELRAAAIAVIDLRLQEMGMKGEYGVHRNADKTRAMILVSLRYGADDNAHLSHGTYQRLAKLAKDGVTIDRGDRFGKRAFALCRKLRGDEFAHVRSDAVLLAALERQAGAKYWERIATMLGLRAGVADKASGDVDTDVLAAEHGTAAKYELDTARQHAADEAELAPSHWSMVLTAALKEARQLRSTEINSIVNRAWTAGSRRELLTRDGAIQLSGTKRLEPMTASDFMKAIHAGLTAGAREKLEQHGDRKLLHARAALEHGTRVTADDQLADAQYRNKLKYTSGFHASYEAITLSFTDLAGKALLDEWSNIEELRALSARHGRAADPGERQRLAELRRDFILDIRADRVTYLERTVPRAQVVEAIGAVRDKLQSAAASDPEAQVELARAGYQNDELGHLRTKNLSLFDAQKLRSTGAQYNTLLGTKKEVKLASKKLLGANAASAESKEAHAMLAGETRKAQQALRDGDDREDVVDEHAGAIEDAQADAERRGDKFDRMQKAYNKIVEGLAKALVYAAMAAAMATITALTGGVGGALAVGLITTKALVTAAVMASVKKALQGDAFNTEKAIWDVAFKTLISGAASAIGAFAVPEVLEAMGESVVTHGDHLTTKTELAAPTDAAGAARQAAIAYGLKKGAKGIMKTAIASARDIETHPQHRALIAVDLAGVIAMIGAKAGAEAFAELNEDVQAGSHGAAVEKTTAGTATALGKAPRAMRYGIKPIKDALDPDETRHGDDRALGADLLYRGAVRAADDAVMRLWHVQLRSHGRERAQAVALQAELFRRRFELVREHGAYEAAQHDAGKEATMAKLDAKTKPILDKAIALLDYCSTVVAQALQESDDSEASEEESQ